MANIALIRGAGIAAPKFTDIRGAVEPGIRTLKNIMSLRQQEADKLETEKKRQDNLKANDYRSLGALQTEGVPDAWQGFVNRQALEVKNENRNLVNLRGEIDQFDYMDNLADQQKKLAKLQNSVNSLKEYSASYVDLLENEDLSDSLTAEELKTINDIVELKGNPIYKDGEVYFVTEAGKEIPMSDLPKLKAKESPLHLEISKGIEGLAENAAKSGMFRDSEYYQNKVKKYLDGIKMTGDQAKSLASDFLGMAGRDGNFADVFNALTGGELVDADGDGDIDEDDYIKSIANIKSDDDFIRRVKEEYKEIALITSDNLKPEYDRINKPKVTPAKGLTPSQQLEEIKEQSEYVDRVTLASEDLGKIKFNDINSISTASGGKVVVFEKDEEGNPNPGGKTIIIDDNIIIPENMTEAQKMRKIVEARVANKMLEQKDVPNLLMSLKITGEEMQTKVPTATELLAKYQ